MSDAVEIWEKPETKEMYLLAGWRQWADAGSVSSGLPEYLIQQTNARKIGVIRPDGFYLFQFPGTHDLVRPVIKFNQGYPESLQTQTNELYYSGDDQRGLVFFVGDEPQLDVERYSQSFLKAAQLLGVKRIIGLGGVYAETPYDKERLITCTYSMPRLKDEVKDLAVNLSDYHGGASIGSYICRRAGEQGLEYVSFYAFVPTYNFSDVGEVGNSIRLENDFMAWLGIIRRISHMIKLDFDLSDLEDKSQKLIQAVDAKIEELDSMSPELGLRKYLQNLSEEFVETPFNPLDQIWEEELRRLLDKFESDES